MNRAQKAAWFIVINFTAAIATSLIVFAVFYPKLGLPRSAYCAVSFMGLCGLSGFVPIIFKKDPGKIQCDERDKMINRKAALAGFGTAYLFVGLACMLPFTIMGPSTKISVTWLPGIFMGAGILTYYAHSITLLIMYGKNAKERRHSRIKRKCGVCFVIDYLFQTAFS